MPITHHEAVVTPNPLPVLGPVTDTEIRATPLPVSGPLTDTQLRATAVPISGTVTATGPLTDAELRATPVPISGTVSVGAASSIATVTNVSVGTSSVTVSASNAAKTKVIVHNETGTLFVKLGSTASSTSYSYRLTANSTVEINGYTGIVTAIKATGTTPVLITEVGI